MANKDVSADLSPLRTVDFRDEVVNLQVMSGRENFHEVASETKKSTKIKKGNGRNTVKNLAST